MFQSEKEVEELKIVKSQIKLKTNVLYIKYTKSLFLKL